MPSSCSTIRNAVETSATFIRATRHQLLQQQEQGANTKSQSKGFPYRSPSLNFLAPEFLALEFFVNALDISKCRLDAVSGARHLACFLVNGAGCSFVHGVFTVSTCGLAAPIGSGLGPTQYKGAWALEYAPAPISRVHASAVTSRRRPLAIGRSPPGCQNRPGCQSPLGAGGGA